MSGIMTAAEYLIEDAAGLLEREHLGVLESIEFSSRQMLAAIEDLAEIAAIESGEFRIDGPPKSLARLIHQAIEESRLATGLNQVLVAFKPDPDPPRVDVDAPRVRLAIRRMIRLSILAVPPGSRIEIRAGRAERNAVVSVRAANAGGRSRPKEPGRTLSVLLIERIAAAHGGSLVSGSQAGRGQLFVLQLPLSTRPRRRSAPVH